MFLFTAMLTNFGVCALAIHHGMLLQLSFGHWERELLDFDPDPEKDSAQDELKISEISKEHIKLTDPKCCWRKVSNSSDHLFLLAFLLVTVSHSTFLRWTSLSGVCVTQINAPGVLTGSIFCDIPFVKGDWSPLLGWHRLEKYFMGSCKKMGHEIHRDFDFSRYISACLDQVAPRC